MGQFTFVACSYQKLEPKNAILKGPNFFWKLFLALTFDRKSYNSVLPHFEISLKFRIFDTRIDLFEETKCLTLFSDFFFHIFGF
jgi:hypothetical protein